MATKYIGPSGSDTTGAGTSGNPWKTLTKAWANVANGDTILMLAGTYSFGAAKALDTAAFSRSNITVTPDAGAAVVLNRTGDGYILDCQNATSCTFSLNGGSVSLARTDTLPSAGINDESISAFRFYLCTDCTVDGWAVTRMAGNGFCSETSSGSTIIRVDSAGTSSGVKFRESDTGGSLIDSHVHDNDQMCRNNNNNADFGGGGVGISHNTQDCLIQGNRIHDNVAVSAFYTYDGSGVETFACGPGNRITDNDIYDCQGLFETGCDLLGHPTWTNGGVEVDHNRIYGTSDFIGSSGSIFLLRAAPDWNIHHNTIALTTGTNNGIFRFESGGTYGGTSTGITTKDNIIQLDYSSQAWQWNEAVQSGWVSDHNLVYYTFNFAGNVYHDPGQGFTKTQLTAAKAATGQLTGDIWSTGVGVNDPLFVDDTNADMTLRDYHLQGGSPAIGASSTGGNMGAFQDTSATAQVASATAAAAGLSAKVAPVAAASTASAAIITPLARDYFTRVDPATMGTADLGGAWTQTLQGTSTLSTDGNLGKAVLAQNANMIGASLLGITALNVDCQCEWEVDKLPLTDIYEMFLMARGSNSVPFNDGYMAHVLVSPTLGINGNFNRVSSSGVRTGIPGAAQAVPGAPAFAPNVRWVMRFQCTGTNPTTLQSKIWRKSDGEPTDWSFTTTDNDAAHQVAGAVGFRFRVDTSTGGLPYTFSFDALTYDLYGGTTMQAPTIAPNAGLASATAAILNQSETVTVPAGAALAAAVASNPGTQVPSNIRHLTITMG